MHCTHLLAKCKKELKCIRRFLTTTTLRSRHCYGLAGFRVRDTRLIYFM